MGTLDSLIVPGYTKDILGSDAESEGRRNRLKVFALATAKSARKGTITDVEGFAQVAAFAISPFQIMDAASNSGGIFDLGEIYIELYLDDLKSVLIGDGWTNTERNYGKYALPYNSFLDTGFKQQFRDGGNQVQHAMPVFISATSSALRAGSLRIGRRTKTRISLFMMPRSPSDATSTDTNRTSQSFQT